MSHYFLLFSLFLLSSLCYADHGLGREDVNLDLMNDIFGSQFSEYESTKHKHLPQLPQVSEMEDCRAFTLSTGVRCVPYHDCDEAGEIIKYSDMNIDVRIDAHEDEDDFTNLYCPGKFDICCKDTDFVSVVEEVFKDYVDSDSEEKHLKAKDTDIEAIEPQQSIKPWQEDGAAGTIKDCSSLASSDGVRCVSYQECDDAGKIVKTHDNLIDVRIDTTDDKKDFTNLYCPGKFDICCQDSDFGIASEEGSSKYNEPELHEANFPLLLQENLDAEDEKYGNELKDFTTTERPPPCPPNWVRNMDSCYYFTTSPSYLTWSGAMAACKELHHNSSLPSVHSEAEDKFLQSRTTSHPFWLGGSRGVGAPYLTPSSWTWGDGSPMNYTAWAKGQPNNYWWGERCVRSIKVEVDGGQTWDDHKCWFKTALALVCKIELQMP